MTSTNIHCFQYLSLLLFNLNYNLTPHTLKYLCNPHFITKSAPKPLLPITQVQKPVLHLDSPQYFVSACEFRMKA